MGGWDMVSKFPLSLEKDKTATILNYEVSVDQPFYFLLSVRYCTRVASPCATEK